MRIVLTANTGVDTELFSPISSQSVSAIRDKWGIAPESFVCLYVGRVSVEKNIEALRHLIRLKHNVTVVVVGSGPLLSQLRQRLPFVFIGELSHEQLPELYQAADCFVMPSFSETYGNVLLESLACGLPVVCHSEYVNSSVVQHESMGLVFNDPESLLDAVQWMIDHPAELNVMGSSALKYTQQHSWEHAYTDLVDIYTEILS